MKVEPQSISGSYMNYIYVAYIKVRYKRNFDLSGQTSPQKITINAVSGKALIAINNVTTFNPSLYILDGDTVKRVVLNKTGNLIYGLVPSNNTEKHCYLVDSLQTYTLTNNMIITPAGTNGYFTNYQTTAFNKEFLIISNKKLWNGATEYAGYRDSSGHPTYLADIDELYDQFSWGIRKHPIAIRNYCDLLLDNLTPKPKFLFLLGKSILSLNARSGANYALNLVPTYGEPASDQMFTSYLNTNQYKPELATGRVATQNDTDTYNYLEKLRLLGIHFWKAL